MALINPDNSINKNQAYKKMVSIPRLSILIATMPKRVNLYDALVCEICSQVKNIDEVEIAHDFSMSYNIGEKRQRLLELSKGDYIVFIDDDDKISTDYISKILKALESSPDCVGISGTMTTNGQNEQQWHISKDFKTWYEQDSIYYRTPNHISPVRRDLALKAGFLAVSRSEDYYYSMRLLPLLETEVKIEGNIYYYDYWTKDG